MSQMQWLNSAGKGWNGISPPVSGVPPPEVTVPLFKVVAPPSGDVFRLDGPHCIFWSVNFREIIKTHATRGHILRLKASNPS